MRYIVDATLRIFDIQIFFLNITLLLLIIKNRSNMANSFKRLMEEEYEPRFTLPINNGMSDFQLIERRLEQQQQTRRFNGDVADLFLPRMVRAIVGMFGGEVANQSDSFDRPAPSDYRSTLPSSGPKGPSNR